jgi:membrane complex biogenesis BtpA family protein
MGEVIDSAVGDALSLTEGGVDGIMVENFWDTPFARGTVEPITVSAMTACIAEIARSVQCPVGVNVLRNDGVAALSIAQVTGARFMRVNVLTSAMVTDQGIVEGCAYELSRLRARLGTEIIVMADVLVKHAYPLGAADLVSVARDTALRGGADVLVVSGPETGAKADLGEVRLIREALPSFPLASGSGLTGENVEQFLPFLDVLIVGTWFKKDGKLRGPVDRGRVVAFIETLRKS